MAVTTGATIRPNRRIGAHQLAPLLSGWREAGHNTGVAVPGYRALGNRIRLLILDGRLPVNTVLPSERALAEELGASRTLTTATYRLLREEGFADGSHGAGTWTALPARTGGEAEVPLAMHGEISAADGHGDLAYAAPPAPPELYAAYASALAELPRYLPGHGYVTAGLPGLRGAVANLYTGRGLPTSAEEVLITSGALHALHLVLAQTVQPGDRVLVEHPTYSTLLDAVRRAGARPVPLPVEDGWNAEHARTVLRQTGARLAVLIPDFHNPTGRLMDVATRAAMAGALADAGCTAVIDETSAELDLRAAFGRPAPNTPPFAVFGRPGGVITIGSASKSIWGGLRIGWVRGERSLIRRLVVARSSDDLAGPVLEQLAATILLSDSEPLLARRRAELAEQCRALRSSLAAELPDWQTWEPDGGLSLWCHLPEPRSSELVGCARSIGLTLHAGPRFGLDGAFESRLRLPFTRPVGHLTAAVRLLSAAWRTPDQPAAAHLVAAGYQTEMI